MRLQGVPRVYDQARTVADHCVVECRVARENQDAISRLYRIEGEFDRG